MKPVRLRRSSPVDPSRQQVVKFFPAMPPRCGETVLVDGDRCRVTRVKVRWREPGVWEIRKLRVKRIGRGGPAGRVRGRGWPLGEHPVRSVAPGPAGPENAGGAL